MCAQPLCYALWMAQVSPLSTFAVSLAAEDPASSSGTRASAVRRNAPARSAPRGAYVNSTSHAAPCS